MTKSASTAAKAASALALCFLPILATGQTIAPDGRVEIYGRANLSVDTYRASGSALGGTADFKSRNRLTDTASRIGVRGTETLGGGLRAIFQIEAGINMDTGTNTGNSGTTNPNTGFWASRDSWLGLEDQRFGRLTFGRQSAYWANGTIEQWGANYINLTSPLTSYTISGILVGPVARESNTIQYSARVGGFSTTLSYGHSATTLAGTSPFEQAQAGQNPRDRFYALTFRYNHSRFDLQYDFAQRMDVAGADNRDMTGHKVGAAWKYMPGAQISLVAQRLKNENTFGIGVLNFGSPTQVLGLAGVTGATATALAGRCGAITAAELGGNAALAAQLNGGLLATGGGGTIGRCDTLRQDMFTLSWEHTFGNVMALAQYGRAGDVKGSSGTLNNTGVQSYVVGARYLMSRRTSLYLTYAQIRNQANNYVDFWGGWNSSASNNGASGLPARSSGADPRVIAIGLLHHF